MEKMYPEGIYSNFKYIIKSHDYTIDGIYEKDILRVA